jgi:hypothetical protein
MKLNRQPAIVRRLIKAAFIGLILILVLLYVLPNVFMALTYFLVPSDTLPPSGGRLVVLAGRDDEVCVATHLVGTSDTVFAPLRSKFLIDGQIVPFWNLDVYYDVTVPFDPTFREDVVCIKPNLAPGEHTIQVVNRNWLDTHSVTHYFQVTEDGLVQPR